MHFLVVFFLLKNLKVLLIKFLFVQPKNVVIIWTTNYQYDLSKSFSWFLFNK